MMLSLPHPPMVCIKFSFGLRLLVLIDLIIPSGFFIHPRTNRVIISSEAPERESPKIITRILKKACQKLPI